MWGKSWFTIKKRAVTILRVSAGSCAAILLAQKMNLEHVGSAGIIALLSMLGTRKDTLRKTADRLISFWVSTAAAWVVFNHIGHGWVTYGIFLALFMSVCYLLGWSDVLSVNAVIGTHYFSSVYMGAESVFNELCLVLVGCGTAILLNLFHPNRWQERQIVRDMREIEKLLQDILAKLSSYLTGTGIGEQVWAEIEGLESHLNHSLELAYEYRDNTFASHTEYYFRYIGMRSRQCAILHHLHEEIKKVRILPEQAEMVAEYIDYVRTYIRERNEPNHQLARFHRVLESFFEEALPDTRGEFEGKAALYHIMMDLEDFLLCKSRFIETLSREQKKIYWNGGE